MKLSYRAACWLVAIGIFAAPAGAQDTSISLEDKLYGLSLIWQEANYNFVYFDRIPDVDWDAEYRSTMGRIIANDDDAAYVREMQRFTALLGEAHTMYLPPEPFRNRFGGRPAVELEEIDRKAVVTCTSTELADQLPIGSVILAVDGVAVEDYLRENVFPYMFASTDQYLWRRAIRGNRYRCVGLLIGEVGTTANIDVERPDGSRATVPIKRLGREDPVEWAGPRRWQSPILEYKELDDGIHYFALNTFNKAEIVTEFEAHLDKLPEAKAVILDIRQNGGGNSSNGWKIGMRFAAEPLEPSHWRTREHRGAYKAWGKHSDDPVKQAHYAMDAWYAPETFNLIELPDQTWPVPVAILVGSSTYSAAEDFLALMRAAPNVVFVGSASAGSTGQPLGFDMPDGGWAQITSKRDVMPDGTEFVGVGVQVDVEVQQTVDAFRAGRDLVLERAIEVLQAELAAR